MKFKIDLKINENGEIIQNYDELKININYKDQQ